MVKKIVISAAVGALLLGFVFGRDAFSYLRTGYSRVREAVKEGVPVTFEIERARKMIQDLEPEIHRNMHLIAREEVEVARLDKQLAQAESGLANDREGIKRLSSDLSSTRESYTYAGRSYSVTQVKADLSNRFNRLKTAEATADKNHRILKARQQGLVAARQKLDGMLAAKRQLEVEVENLEARQKMVEVAQTSSEFNLDDSQLARTRELLDEIGTRLEVAERLATADVTYADEIPLEEPTSQTDICQEVANYLSQRESDSAELAYTEAGE